MNEHIKDRGTKKWTSIMLPEHVKALRELNAELNKVEKPILDEQIYGKMKLSCRWLRTCK